MTSPAPAKARQIARIRRLRGQLEALERALGNDQDFRELLRQMAAVRGACNSLLSNFIADCLQNCLQASPAAGARSTRKDAARLEEAIRSYLR